MKTSSRGNFSNKDTGFVEIRRQNAAWNPAHSSENWDRP
jgi:hypothetical protein